jgi:Flp pilus assembly protein TadD
MGWAIALALTLPIAPAFGLSAAGHRQQGLLYRQQSQYAAAIAAFQKSVELEPENISGQVLLGWTQHLAKQPAAAATTLETALALNPFHVETANALGIVYLVGNQLTAAVMTHSWATVLKPDNEISYYNLSLAWQRLGQYDWAIAAANAAAQLEPNNPHPLVAAAIAHWGNGDQAQAQRTYRQAQRLNPGFADPVFLQEDLTAAAFSQTQVQIVQAIGQRLPE